MKKHHKSNSGKDYSIASGYRSFLLLSIALFFFACDETSTGNNTTTTGSNTETKEQPDVVNKTTPTSTTEPPDQNTELLGKDVDFSDFNL